MANIMNMADIRNNVSRNGFDLANKFNFTAKAGELLPCGCWEIVPGDVFNISLRSITRTKPVNTAAFARIREYYDFYFVDYELLWNRAFSVLTQMSYNQNHADGLAPLAGPLVDELPYMTCEQIAHYVYTMATTSFSDFSGVNFFGFSRAKQTVKLLDYLGYGDYSAFLTADWSDTNRFQFNVDMNIMALLAYQKVYADWFRDQNWERVQPFTFNVDYMTGKSSMQIQLPVSLSDDFYHSYNMFDLRYCNWQKDLFHGVLPRAQYGEEAVVPIGGSTTFSAASSPTLDIQSYDTTINFSSAPVAGSNSATMGEASVKSSYVAQVAGTFASDAFSFSILALRQAEFLQKWKEIAQAGNQDYKDFVKRVWNTNVGDGYSERCEYLGGTSSSLDINEVVNNNITSDNVADIAGKGFGISNGNVRFDSRGRYGVLMCIYHALPIVDYTTNYQAPMHTRVNAADFANPVFDKVGMQPVYLSNMDNEVWQSTSGRFSVPLPIGYAPRYIDYKTAIDRSVGDFKNTLKNWVLSYNGNDIIGIATGDYSVTGPGTAGAGGNTSDSIQPSQPWDDSVTDVNDIQKAYLTTYIFFKMSPKVLDPIFADNATEDMSTDQFLCSTFFDVKAVRNLDTNGLPY